MRKLSVTLSAAIVAAGVLAAPVGGGSNIAKPTAKAGKTVAQPVRLCKRF